MRLNQDFQSPLRRRSAVLLVACAIALAGCASPGLPGFANAGPSDVGSTRVLLTLGDGSVVERRTDSDDDVCVESVPLGVSMCYAKGAERIDPVSGDVVGHEMVLTRAIHDTRRSRD